MNLPVILVVVLVLLIVLGLPSMPYWGPNYRTYGGGYGVSGGLGLVLLIIIILLLVGRL